ncbi:MAG: hypothetical protein VKJ64_16315 [Leptolyngbyaceae bacterium]|nr:hypothetical protein [Leptolyngbyaceae bacterium]
MLTKTDSETVERVSVASIGHRLEQYTIKHREEVLLVTAFFDGHEDQIAIFRGFSSSLMHPTAFDPDVPVLPAHADIQSVDRLEGPYNPHCPRIIERGLSLEQMEALLNQAGL